MPEFYITFARKIFFLYFYGGRDKMSPSSCHRKCDFFSVDRYIFRMKFPTGFTYRNLLGFALFPGDSTALVVISIVAVYSSTATMAVRHIYYAS